MVIACCVRLKKVRDASEGGRRGEVNEPCCCGNPLPKSFADLSASRLRRAIWRRVEFHPRDILDRGRHPSIINTTPTALPKPSFAGNWQSLHCPGLASRVNNTSGCPPHARYAGSVVSRPTRVRVGVTTLDLRVPNTSVLRSQTKSFQRTTSEIHASAQDYK